MIVLNKQDFEQAEKYAEEQTRDEELVGVTLQGFISKQNLYNITRAAFIAGLNWATIRHEKQKAKRR